MGESVDPITSEKLVESMKSIENRKAPGLDGINIEFLKCGESGFKFQLLKLINEYWKRGKSTRIVARGKGNIRV